MTISINQLSIISTNYCDSNYEICEPNIWYYSQLGLLSAAFDLRKTNNHIKIYASLDRMVLEHIDIVGEIKTQVLGTILNLYYSYDDLKQMYKMTIENEHNSNLNLPEHKKNDPDLSMFGIVGYSFHDIYRMSLKRPRDIMIMCSKIMELPKSKDKQDYSSALWLTMKDVAIGLIHQYISEFSIYVGSLNFSLLANFLNTNILSLDKLKNICSEYNSILYCENGCSKPLNQCLDKQHPFCMMFNAGLLGIIVLEGKEKKHRQIFLSPSENVYYLKSNNLLQSPYYILHPSLSEWIMQKYDNFYKSQSIIGGDGLPWPDNWCSVNILISFMQEDLESLEDLIGLLTNLESEGFNIIYDNILDGYVNDNGMEEKFLNNISYIIVLMTDTFCNTKTKINFINKVCKANSGILNVITLLMTNQNVGLLQQVYSELFYPISVKTYEINLLTIAEKSSIIISDILRLLKVD